MVAFTKTYEYMNCQRRKKIDSLIKEMNFSVKFISYFCTKKNQSIVINIMNIYLETTDTSCQSQNCQNILWNRGHNGLKADLGNKNIKNQMKKYMWHCGLKSQV